MSDPSFFFGIVAAFAATAAVALAFTYLAATERRPGLTLLALGWLAYAARLALQLADTAPEPGPALFIADQAATIASSWLLLAGVQRWLGRGLPWRWAPVAAAALLWTAGASLLEAPFLARTGPPFAFVALVYARIGFLLLAQRPVLGLGRHFAGWVFIVWAVHKADYPFLRPIAWFAPWGFLLAFVLTLLAAFGLIVLYFDQARHDLAASEGRLHLVSNGTRDILYRLRVWPQVALEYVSPSFATVTGLDPEEVRRNFQLLADRVHPDDRPRIDARLAGQIRPEELGAGATMRFRRPDGTLVWLEQRSTPVFDERGRLVALEGIARDITDRALAEESLRGLRDRLEELVDERTRELAAANARLQAEIVRREGTEAALRESEERWRSLVDNAPSRILIVDQAGRIIYVNSSPDAPEGSPDRSAVGRTVYEFIAPDHHKRVRATIAHIFETGRSGWYEVARTRAPGGETSWYETHAGPIFKGGAVFAVTLISTDITERRRNEDALVRSERRYRSLVQGTAEGFWSVDERALTTDVNPALCALLGRSREELIGRPAVELADDASRPELLRQQARIPHTDHRHFEVSLARKDGSPVPVYVHGTTVRDADGRAVGAFAFITDLSEQKRAEAARREMEAHLDQTQRLESLGVLAGGIAHDFNNLLVGVLGNATLAAQELPPDAAGARECVREIEIAARRAAELTRQLLAYAGKGRYVVERVQLAALIDDMRDLLVTSTSRRATLAYALAPDLPPIEADAGQLRQVVLSLVTNASEALPDGQGHIAIRVAARDFAAAELNPNLGGEQRPGGRYVVLEVEDDGEGIDDDARRRVFEPFYTTRFTGRGLGLPAVLGIVRSHGGVVQFESRRGVGSRFRVLLPVAAAAAPAPGPGERPPAGGDAAAPANPKAARRNGGGRLVLVADDEPTIRRLTQRVLERAGYAVALAEDGEQAVTLFRRRPADFHAALLDLSMPGLGGVAVAAAIRALRPELPIVLSSGYSEQEFSGRFADDAPARFIQKPYRPRELEEVISAALAADRPDA